MIIVKTIALSTENVLFLIKKYTVLQYHWAAVLKDEKKLSGDFARKYAAA